VHITRNQKIDLSKLLRSDPWNEKLEDKNTSSPNALTGHHQLLVQYMEQAENFMVNPISSTVLVEEAYHSALSKISPITPAPGFVTIAF